MVERCDRSVAAPGLKMERAILFDRDGVLNVDHGYVASRDRFEWMPGAVEALHRLYESGYGVGVVTNQSGIGRGYYREAEFLELMSWVCQQAPIHTIRYCPHAPESACPGRKPGPLMVLSCLDWFGCRPDGALLVGDKPSDIEAAAAAGIRSAKFDGGDLWQFVQALL